MKARLLVENDGESRLYLFGPNLPANGYRVSTVGVDVFGALKERTSQHAILSSLGEMQDREALNSLIRNGYTVVIRYVPGAFKDRYGEGVVVAAQEPVKLPENVIRNFGMEALTPIFFFNGKKTKRQPFKEYLGQKLTQEEQLTWDAVEMSMAGMPANGVGYTPVPGANYYEPDESDDGYQERHEPTVRAEEFPENKPKSTAESIVRRMLD